MKNWPNIFKFLGVFMMVYLTLSAATYIKPIRGVVVPVYNGFQQAVFNMAHPVIRTDYRSYEGQSELYDFSIDLYSKQEYKRSQNKRLVNAYITTNYEARLIALGPFIMLISLVLASPITWKRKLLAFGVGSFIILLLLAMKFTAIFDANLDSSLAFLKDPDSGWIGISKFLNDAFRTNEFLALIIIPIWAISSFRLKDWKWFIE